MYTENGITLVSQRLELPAARLYNQLLAKDNNKENIKNPSLSTPSMPSHGLARHRARPNSDKELPPKSNT